MKQKKSFWKPFLDYLPEKNETLFTVNPDTVISEGSTATLWSEIQKEDDDIFKWIHYDRDVNDKARARFKEYITDNFAELKDLLSRMNV